MKGWITAIALGWSIAVSLWGWEMHDRAVRMGETMAMAADTAAKIADERDTLRARVADLEDLLEKQERISWELKDLHKTSRERIRELEVIWSWLKNRPRPSADGRNTSDSTARNKFPKIAPENP